MTALESRKLLLLAESELNRAQLVHQLQLLAGELQALAVPARTASSVTAAVAALLAVWSAFRHRHAPSPGQTPSWWKVILKGAGGLGLLWLHFRPSAPPGGNQWPARD